MTDLQLHESDNDVIHLATDLFARDKEEDRAIVLYEESVVGDAVVQKQNPPGPPPPASIHMDLHDALRALRDIARS